MENCTELPHGPEVQCFDATHAMDNSQKSDSFEVSSPSQVSEVSTPDKNESILIIKPTFKSTLQAKKRLQAYKSGSVPTSPLAKKPKLLDDKQDKDPPKTTPRKDLNLDEKARAVIVEDAKRKESSSHLESSKSNSKRSRSKSFDKERFKKVETKSRNYRKRSPTPDKSHFVRREPKKMPPKKYPSDWEELRSLNPLLDFGVIRELDPPPCRGFNAFARQLLFEAPPLPIDQFIMKTVNRDNKVVPFEYIRYTQAKPLVAFSANCTAIKESCLSRREVFNVVSDDIITAIDKLHSSSLKFKTDGVPITKVRCWFPKSWCLSGEAPECKVVENSVGLSFVQTYSGGDGDVEIIEEEIVVEEARKDNDEAKTPEMVPKKKNKKSKKGKSKAKDNEEEVSVKKKKKKHNGKAKKHSTDDEIDSKKKKKRKKDKVAKKDKSKEKKVKDEEVKTVPDEDVQVGDEKKKKGHHRNDSTVAITPEKVKKRKSSDREDNPKRIKHENDRRKSRERLKISKTLKDVKNEGDMSKTTKKSDEIDGGKEETPDTDEYHSHWESDEDVATASMPKVPLKTNRSWESDEELFERTYNRQSSQPETYEKLEMPLTINSFSRRVHTSSSQSSGKTSKWAAKPAYLDVESEMKLLEKERRSLTEERRKLEIEKAKVMKLQEESSSRDVVASTPPDFDLNRVKSEKSESSVNDFNIDSLNNSLLSNVSSMESTNNFPALENEYEEFMKALSTDTDPPPNQPLPIVYPTAKNKKSVKKSSTDGNSSSSSTSSSESERKRKKKKSKLKKKKKKVKNIFDEFDIPVPSDLPDVIMGVPPLPVPSPTTLPIGTTSNAIVFNSVLDLHEDIENMAETPPLIDGLDLSKPFVFPTITISPKKPLLVDNSKLKLNDDSDSGDFTDKFVKRPDEVETKTVEVEKVEEKGSVEVKNPKVAGDRFKKKEPRGRRSPPNRKPDSFRRRPSPPRRRFSPLPRRRRSPSPRRRSISPRRRSLSPRRRSPPLRRSRFRSPFRRSPSPGGFRRSLSPRSRCARKRSLSPRPRRGSSPLNSPLDGFKRSVADSTISDDMLPQPSPKDYSQSPPTFRNSSKYYSSLTRRRSQSPNASPRRLSLDDRINQVLGLEHKSQHDNYHQHYNYPPPQYDQYGQYHYGQYSGHKNDYPQNPYAYPPPPSQAQSVKQASSKVVQIGNILQVVPSDDIPQTLLDSSHIKVGTPAEVTQKIVQVGNMLQIVPAPGIASRLPVIESPSVAVIIEQEKQSAEAALKQKNAERKAEREKRRTERERRRKEKERKRKDKEKKRQMKLKLKTENMIKKALQLEGLDNEEGEEEGDDDFSKVEVIVSPLNTSSSKGILCAGKLEKNKMKSELIKRKSVQFADGIRPGEGTSPSGGEELSSPPPVTMKLHKEKRFRKLKIPRKSKKKKIKVKVIKRSLSDVGNDDDDEEDDLPPPSPPPGSPPPHVFPSRVKTHTINNVHQYVVSGPGSYVQQFRSSPMPVVINRGGAPSAGFLPGAYHPEVHNLPHPTHHSAYPGTTIPGHGVSSHH